MERPELEQQVAILALIPVRSGELCAGGDETLAEALTAGGAAILLIHDETDLSDEVRRYISDQVQVIACGDFAPGRWADLLALLVVNARVLVLPGSPDGRDLAPRLAARLGRPLLAGALQITAEQVSVPRAFGTELHRFTTEGPVVTTLQVGVRGVADGEIPTAADASPALIPAAGSGHRDIPGGHSGDVIVEKVLEPDVATMDLAEAPRIMGGGAGLAEAGDFDRLGAVAKALGAAMGATRVITDRGWIHHDRQIGTTGVIVDPDLYLAWGISGAVQHTAGLGHPSHIISINTDPHCPMMQLADLSIVSDAPAVLRALAKKLDVPHV
jgi:electron transfer flavoprotein alpha subunit